MPEIENHSVVKGSTFVLFFLLTAAGLWKSILFLGHHQFGGFDQSALIDLLYRMHLGQKPFLDFPCTVPPLFLIPGRWIFRIGGLSWTSIVQFTALFSIFTFSIQTILFRKLGASRVISLLSAFTVQICGQVVSSYWWYNSVTAVLAALTLTAACLLIKKPNLGHWAILSVLAAALAMTKPNSAGLVLFGVISGIFLLPQNRKSLVFALGVVTVATLTLLSITGISPTRILPAYLSIAGRGLPTLARFEQDEWPQLLFRSWIGIWLSLAPIVVPWLYGLWQKESNSFNDRLRRYGMALSLILSVRVFLYFGAFSLLWGSLALYSSNIREWMKSEYYSRETLAYRVVFCGGLMAGLLALFTNGELKWTDLSMVITVAVLATVLRPTLLRSRNQIRLAEYGLMACLVSISGLASLSAFHRDRIKAIGEGKFYQTDGVEKIGPENAFFTGLYAGPVFRTLLGQLGKTIETSTDKSRPANKVFFGPRLQFGYAAFGLEPPKGLPPFWQNGVSFPDSMIPQLADSFYKLNFDRAYLFRSEFDFMPQKIINYVNENFESTIVGDLDIRQRKRNP